MFNHFTLVLPPEEERFDPLHILITPNTRIEQILGTNSVCLGASEQGNKEGREDWAFQSWQQASRWLPSPALR